MDEKQIDSQIARNERRKQVFQRRVDMFQSRIDKIDEFNAPLLAQKQAIVTAKAQAEVIKGK